MKQKNISILALLLMAVTGAWAQGSGGDNWGPVQTSSAAWTALTEGSTTGMTLGAADATTYYYMTENLTFSNNTAGGSGLTIQGTVYIYIPSGVTLTATGADGEGTTGGGAGILVPSGTTLNIFGEGTIVATGGNAANGGNGGNGTAASFVSPYYYAGLGGAGGNGGGGAGAGIGTAGGNGGNGAAQLAEEDASRPKANTEDEEWNGELSGLIGTNGTGGATAAAVGTVNIASTITQTIAGGAKGVGGAAGLHGGYICYGDGDVYSSSADGDSPIDVPTFETVTIAVAGGGGGGGGAGGGSAQAIGTGGAGGGGGASGACGSGRAEDSWRNDDWTYVGAGGGAGGAGTDSNNGASGYTCYFMNDDAEFDEEDNHKPGGVGGSAGAASATKTAGTAAAPTYTITYFEAMGAELSKTSEDYTFGSDTKITLPTIHAGGYNKWMLSKYGRAFGETTSHCAGPNGDIYEPGTEVNLSNIYGDLEFTTVYIGCQIDCRSQTESTLTSFSPDKYAVVNLKNRKLYKDGYWNTLTLPFSLSSEKLATTCLAGADIRVFESASWDGGNQKLTINFSESGEIVAGVPYIIRWGTPETATGEVIVNPSFTNVEVESISQEELDDEGNYCETESEGLRFEAQIAPVQLTSGSNALVFGNENKLYKPKDDLYVYATRAYFSYSGSISMARQIVMDFGDGDQQTTYIDGITVDGNRGSGVEGIFNLSGQRLSAPQKGINIVNGKKVLVGDKR